MIQVAGNMVGSHDISGKQGEIMIQLRKRVKSHGKRVGLHDTTWWNP